MLTFVIPHSTLEPIQQCLKTSVAILFSFQSQSFLFEKPVTSVISDSSIFSSGSRESVIVYWSIVMMVAVKYLSGNCNI